MNLQFFRLGRSACAAGIRLLAAASLVAFTLSGLAPVHAQTATGTGSLSGSVLDPRGVPLPGASILLRDESTGATQKASSDAEGKYMFSNLPTDKFTLQVDGNGFNTGKRSGIQVGNGPVSDINVTLELGNVSEQVTVEAAEANSVAAAMAPMDALLEQTSPHTEITQAFIQNFTAPTADYGELVALAPGTFTTNGNGVGLGQSKTFFRGFPDGDYDIDYDSIPFYDTNSPTHHSWVFFPSQWIGGVDFDRSPGTASTTGPTPFGGSIHLLSRDLSPVKGIRGTFSYASFNTLLVDGQYDTGTLLPNHKLSLSVDVHHMSSDGYQTFNYQRRSAGELKALYKFSPTFSLTGFSGVVRLDANTPNFNATRCQMYGVSATGAYSCNIAGTNTLMPFTGAGLNFYLTDNSDPYNWLNYQYNHYHIPTDFEYIGVHKEFARGVTLDVKPYTYDYDNGELYSNNTPITESTTINGSKTYLGVAIAPCNVAVVKKGVSAIPCGVDKYNSYRKYGETSTISQVSKFGILRGGMWYEWARTDRHQYPTDPANNWADQTFPNFAEQFWNNSLQPFVEYQFHVTSKLSVTPGVKYAYNSISTKQYADDGKTIGLLAPTLAQANPKAFISNYGTYSAWLPSLDGNYRLRSNWTAYGQLATGTIVPPSNVYDYNQTVSASNPNPHLGIAPKQQRSTTYQFGTVLKLKRLTLDADYYHIRFQNSYSSFTDQSTDTQNFYLQPASISKGFEAESNLYFGRGLSGYFNATVGRAYYVGNVYQACTSGTAGCTASTPVLTETAPSGLWVSNTPSDTEAMGLTYSKHGWDAGFFNKRVGTMWLDNGSYHNQMSIDPFNASNMFVNYTIRRGSLFDQTKIKLSFNNIFNQHNITNVSGLGPLPSVPNISANNATYVDAFRTNGITLPTGTDSVSVLAARSVSIAITFGLSPKR